MAKSMLPEGKRRYSILLTETNYAWISHFITAVCKQPKSQVAVTIDEMLFSMKDAIQPILDRYEKDGRVPTAADLMVIVGQQLQKIGSDEIDLIK